MARYGKRDFQLDEFYLSQRKNSPAWCRTWYDNGSRQTKRESLGTEDYEEAKKRLTEWFVLNQTKPEQELGDTLIAAVINRYWEQHGKTLASEERTRYSLKYWLEFFGEKTVEEAGSAQEQEAFRAFLFSKGKKPSSVSRVLSAGRAAINRAWKRGEIKAAPFIPDVPKKGRDESQPRGRPLEVAEMAALLDATRHPHLQRFMLFMIAAAARPDAIRDLTIGRCDLDSRLIILNPDGRKQTSKFRPTVRMPESIVPLVETLKAKGPDFYIVGFGNKPVASVKSGWRTARAKAGLDDQVNPYSIRHTMARWMRKEGVPAWEVSAQLGHKRQEMSITEVYAPYDPAYLEAAQRAIDSFFAQLRAKSVLAGKMLSG